MPGVMSSVLYKETPKLQFIVVAVLYLHLSDHRVGYSAPLSYCTVLVEMGVVVM